MAKKKAGQPQAKQTEERWTTTRTVIKVPSSNALHRGTYNLPPGRLIPAHLLRYVDRSKYPVTAEDPNAEPPES